MILAALLLLRVISSYAAAPPGSPRSLAAAVAAAEGRAGGAGGRVFMPPGVFSERVAVRGNVTLAGAPGAVWRGCGGALLTVEAGGRAEVSGVRFRDDCPGNGTVGIDFRPGGGGRVERCAFETDVGVRASGWHADAALNFWGAATGPRVRSDVATGGRPAGGGALLALRSERARAEWAPFSTSAFHTQAARVFAVWPAQGGEACPRRGAVAGLVGNATLEYAVSGSDPSCGRSSGRRPLAGAGPVLWASVRPDGGGGCGGARAARHATYRLEAEPVQAEHDFFTNGEPVALRATRTLVSESVVAPLEPAPSAEADLSVERATYQLRGAMTYEGPCAACFMEELRARPTGFEALRLSEDGNTVYFRGDARLPASRKALALALRRAAASAAAATGGGSATIWASPELVAEVHLVARGTSEERVAAALAAAELLPSREARVLRLTQRARAAALVLAALGVALVLARGAARAPREATPQQQGATGASGPSPAPAPAPASALAAAPQPAMRQPCVLPKGAVLVPWTPPGGSLEPVSRPGGTARPGGNKARAVSAAGAEAPKPVFVRQRKKNDQYHDV